MKNPRLVGAAATLALLALALAACGTPSPAPEVDAPAPTCADLYDQFAAAAATLDDSCDTVADCAAPGGKLGDETCDCAPTLPDVAVSAAAYAGSDAERLAARYAAECDGAGGVIVCDAAPAQLACTDHRCVVTSPSCLDPVDAGP